MLRLIESGARPRGRAGWTFVSSLVHGSFIAVAVLLTLREQLPAVPETPRERVLFTAPRPDRPSAPPGAAAGGTGAVTIPRLRLPLITVPPAHGLSFDLPGLFPTPGPEPVGSGLPGGGGFLPGGQGVEPGGIHRLGQVDRAVIPRRDNPRPEYPATLRTALLEGDVVVRFVVDTSGSVEAGSGTILGATHELFADAVRRWLPLTRYTPAQVRGQRVRQLVEQRVNFELAR